MFLIKNAKANYLLFIGAGLFFCTLFLMSFFQEELLAVGYESSRTKILDNFVLSFFLAIFINPITEEFSFRAIFTKNRFLKLISCCGIPLFIIVSSNYYLLILYVFFLIVLKFYSVNSLILYITSSLIFALAHYQLKDLFYLGEIVGLINHIGFSFVMIWITLNFKFYKSVFTHALFNMAIMLPIFISLQFPDQTVQEIKQNGVSIRWRKVPIFAESPNMQMGGDFVDIRNYTLKEFQNILHISKNKYVVVEGNNYYKFEVKIESSENSNLNEKQILVMLLKAKLIEKNYQ